MHRYHFSLEFWYEIISIENKCENVFSNFSLQYLKQHKLDFYGVCVEHLSIECRLLLAKKPRNASCFTLDF